MKTVKSFRNERPQKKVQTDEEIAASLGVNVSYIAEFREMFRLIDIDDSDTLSIPELRILFENLNIDTLLMDEEFFKDLLGRVQKIQRRTSIAPTPGGRRHPNQHQLTEIAFDELMAVILTRPTVHYTKSEVLNYFSRLSSKSDKPGTITVSALRRAVACGDGGMDHALADDLLTMFERVPGGKIDYRDLVELYMGTQFRAKTPAAAPFVPLVSSGKKSALLPPVTSPGKTKRLQLAAEFS